MCTPLFCNNLLFAILVLFLSVLMLRMDINICTNNTFIYRRASWAPTMLQDLSLGQALPFTCGPSAGTSVAAATLDPGICLLPWGTVVPRQLKTCITGYEIHHSVPALSALNAELAPSPGKSIVIMPHCTLRLNLQNKLSSKVFMIFKLQSRALNQGGRSGKGLRAGPSVTA
jgi:hypothetical protein